MLKDILTAIVRLKTIAIDVSDEKFLAAATDYAAEDVLSEAASGGTVFTFNNIARRKGGGGTIRKAIAFISTTALAPLITLYLYKSIPVGINLNDNAANAGPDLVNIPSFQGQIDFLALEDLGGGSTSLVTSGTYGNLPLRYMCVDRSLRGIAVTRSAITGEVAGMKLKFLLHVEQD